MKPTFLMIEGRVVAHTGTFCYLRMDDRMIGMSRKRPPKTMSDVRWYTMEWAAAFAKVPVSMIQARLREGWGFADLIKPLGWEVLVKARREGIVTPFGRMSIKEASKKFGVSITGLEHRILNKWDKDDILAPGRRTREPLPDSVASQVQKDPPVGGMKKYVSKPLTARCRFYFRGYMDTLPGHAKAMGINPATVRDRIRNGMTVAEALTTGRKTRSDKGKPNSKRSVPRSFSSQVERMHKDLDIPPYDGSRREPQWER